MPVTIIHSMSTDEIRISLNSNIAELSTYHISNHEGKIVRRGKIPPSLQHDYFISVSGLPLGNYVFSLLNEELRFNKQTTYKSLL